MTYKEALDYIYSFTDYERGGSYTRKREENILREAALLELLGDPHHDFSNTLIAGTKGKGSTSAYIERVLREAGLRTGLYTQPDLHTFRERIRVNGRLIAGDEVGSLIPEIRACVEQIEAGQQFGPFITYEIGTALAFLYFSRQHVQHAVVEVGLGGRLDATNVTHPLVSVITSISFDHTNVLGNTLGKIATEKAGIIKPDGVVVTSAQSPEALLAIAAVARQRNARIIRVGLDGEDPAQAEVLSGQLPPLTYRYRLNTHDATGQHFTIWTPECVYADLETPLLGTYQLENATVALATLDLLRERNISWDEAALRSGFHSVRWPGRIEIVGHEPTIVVDGAHNADSMQKLIEALRSTFSIHRLIAVFSTNRDKDLVGMVRALADIDVIVLTRLNNPRASTIEHLSELFAEYAPCVRVYSADNSSEAMDLARDLAVSDDLICATGSIYLAAEALRWAAAHGDTQAALEIEGVDH